MEEKTKIFCIGLNKTGTSSLHTAFKKLDLKSVHYRDENKNNIKNIILNNYNNGNKLLLGIENYDAYSDWNHPNTNILFKELDKQYPNSKFILNTRALEGWLLSREKHVNRIPNLKKLQKEDPNDTWLGIDIDLWKVEYDEHHRNVYDYFKNRENDLLVFDVTKGDGWDKLCTFLNIKNIPETPFPRLNTAVSKSFKSRLKKKLSKILKKINFFS